MNPVDILKSILAHYVCDSIRCDDCKRLFDMDSCPSDRFDYDTRCDFAKELAKVLQNGSVDLGEIQDLQVDDLLRVVQDAYEEYIKPRGPLD